MFKTFCVVVVVVAFGVVLQVCSTDAKAKGRGRRRRCPHVCVRKFNEYQKGNVGPTGPRGQQGPPGPPGLPGPAIALPACKSGEYLTSDGYKLKCEKFNFASVCPQVSKNSGCQSEEEASVKGKKKMIKFIENNKIQEMKMDGWDVKAFYIGDSLFFGLSQLPSSFHMYKWYNSSVGFLQFQDFKILNARNWEPFTIGDEQYFVVASMHKGTSCPLYKWNKHKRKFESTSSPLPCDLAFDVETFELAGIRHIAVTNYNINGPVRIFRWNGNKFSIIQEINLVAQYIKAFEIKGVVYVGISGAIGEGPYVILHKWNGSTFKRDQKINAIDRPYEVAALTVGDQNFLSIATVQTSKKNQADKVLLFVWDRNTEKFKEFQQIPSLGARRIAAISSPLMGKENTYLAVMNYFDVPVIYVSDRVSGKFKKLHDIKVDRARDISFFEMNGSVYLVLAAHNRLYVYKGAAV